MKSSPTAITRSFEKKEGMLNKIRVERGVEEEEEERKKLNTPA